MRGLIALLGSGEYLPVMNDVDAHLLASVNSNGRKPRVACLPTAAGQEGEASVTRWSAMGVDHFTRLGADVQSVPVIDKDSASDGSLAAVIENADLIYFSGGNPQYLFETMRGSRAWEAAQNAWARGAAYAGCSAGAMVLGAKMPDMRAGGLKSIAAFGLVPATFIIPHFDAIPGLWKPVIFALRRNLKKDEIILGIEEDTALVGKLGGEWTVMGRAKVHVLRKDGARVFGAGERVHV